MLVRRKHNPTGESRKDLVSKCGTVAGQPLVLRISSLRRLTLGPVSLEVRAGECVCVSGVSGAGKTILLRAIADLDPYEGTVFLDDVSCADIRPVQWRSMVGLLPPESMWWGMRVGDHFPEVNADWLKRMGFTEEVMDRRVEVLSSGERQRLGLLRLLANQPRVLLLDEPTANLDQANISRMELLVEQYRRERGAAVIWVSHDPGQIQRVADRHLGLVGGELRSQTQ